MPQVTLILHNIRSVHNVGSIFRTAEGFSVNKIILSGYTPYPTHPDDTRLPHEALKITQQLRKVALGAESMVPFEHIASLDAWLITNRLPLIGLEQTPSSVDIRHYVPPEQFALLLGEEVDGIATRYIERCQTVLEIPMYGKKESFNVSVAAGIALYALMT